MLKVDARFSSQFNACSVTNSGLLSIVTRLMWPLAAAFHEY